MKLLNTIRSAVCLLLLSNTILLLLSNTIWAAPVPLDKVVAVVNTSVLTQNQLNETIQAEKQHLQATNQPIPSDAALRKKALDRAIGELLQLQVAKNAKIVVSDQQVTRAIGEIAKQNNLSMDQLKEELQKQGINYSTYRTQIHDQMVLQQVRQQALAGKVHVSEAEVQAYLKNSPAPNNQQAAYRLDDLLIPLEENATPTQIEEVTQQAKALLKQAQNGVNFNELAQPPVRHVDLGWRAAKDLPDVFVEAVQKIKPGALTDIVRAPNGLHILRLLDARGHMPAMTVAEARQRVLEMKVQEESDKWSAQLRKTAYVKIM